MSAIVLAGGKVLGSGSHVFATGSGGGGGGPVPTLFISTTGNDSNNGLTPGTAWAITSLLDNSANQTTMKGKVIGMVSGTYNTSSMQSASSPNAFDTPVFSLPQGTLGSPTYLCSCNSSGVYQLGAALLDNSSSTTANPLIGQDPSLAGFWTLDGLRLKGNPNNTVSEGYFLITGRYAFSAGNAGPVVTSASDITIQNCEIFNLGMTANGGQNSGGCIMQGVQAAQFLNNYVHDIVSSGTGTNPEHMHGYEEFGSQNSIIHFNTFANCQGGGVDIKTGCSGQDIAFNYFYLCGTTDTGNGSGAITGCDGQEGNPNSPSTMYTVHHNVFDSNQQEMSVDVGGSGRSQSISFFNNTIYNVLTGSVPTATDMRQLVAGQTSQYYNNIILTTGITGSSTGDSGSIGAFSAGRFSPANFNCYFLHSQNQAWSQGSTLITGFTTWQASAGSPDANSTTANPTFSTTITPANGPVQFQLGGSSPVLSTGANPGRVGGTTGGAAVNMGAWDGVVTQIGAAWVSYPVS